jgi:hypothetical protein
VSHFQTRYRTHDAVGIYTVSIAAPNTVFVAPVKSFVIIPHHAVALDIYGRHG